MPKVALFNQTGSQVGDIEVDAVNLVTFGLSSLQTKKEQVLNSKMQLSVVLYHVSILVPLNKESQKLLTMV